MNKLQQETISRIENLLEEYDMSQAEFSRRINLSTTSLNRIMKSTRKISADELSKMSDVLNVTVDYLLGKTTSKKGKTPENATENDLKDLKNFMEHNDGSMTYGGEELTETEKEQLKFAMETVFWKRQRNKKETKGNDDKE